MFEKRALITIDFRFQRCAPYNRIWPQSGQMSMKISDTRSNALHDGGIRSAMYQCMGQHAGLRQTLHLHQTVDAFQ